MAAGAEATSAIVTPVKRATFSISAEAGPSRSRLSGSSPAYVSSPGCISHSAHDLHTELETALFVRH